MTTTTAVTQASIEHSLSAAERAELEWWRKVFACRFRSDNLPRVGSALHGRRFLLVEDIEGALHEVKRR